MFYDMIDSTLTTLRNHWIDLAESFERLANEIQKSALSEGESVEPQALANLAEIDGNTPTGLQCQCLLESKRLEDQRLQLIQKALQQPDLISFLFEQLKTVFSESDNVYSDILNKYPNSFGSDETDTDKTKVQQVASPSNQPHLILTKYVLLPEYDICELRLDRLKEFIDRTQLQFAELTDKEKIGTRGHIAGIDSSVKNLSSYPLIIADGGSTVRSATSPGGATSGFAGTTVSLQRTVEMAFKDVLGRVPRPGDTRSFTVALNQSFEVTEVAGHTEYLWRPRTYSGQTDLGGGVTGGQASLYARAKVAIQYALPLVDQIDPLIEDPDQEKEAAARSIVRTTFSKIVDELGVEGGPRVARVEALFDQLIGPKSPNGQVSAQDFSNSALGYMQENLGLEDENVLTLDEEANLTRFISLRDYVQSVRDSWDNFNTNLLGRDLGTRLVQLSRTLDVAAETVGEIEAAMDSVNIGSAERQVIKFRDDENRELTISEYLSWVVDFTKHEAPDLIREGGKRGVGEIIPTVTQLQSLLQRLIYATSVNHELPGLSHPRVQYPLRELRGHLNNLIDMASKVRAV